MDLFDAIEKRYSYREEFTDASVSRADLEKTLDSDRFLPLPVQTKAYSLGQ